MNMNRLHYYTSAYAPCQSLLPVMWDRFLLINFGHAFRARPKEFSISIQPPTSLLNSHLVTVLNDAECCRPFKPQYQHARSPHCSSYISYGISWENLLTYQDSSSLVTLKMISLILITCMFLIK